MGAKQKPIETLSLADLGLGADDVAATQRVAAIDRRRRRGPARSSRATRPQAASPTSSPKPR